MRIQKIICNRCGHEIQDKRSCIIYPQIIEAESRDIMETQPYAAEMNRDYCEKCLTEVMDFLHKKQVRKN